MLETRETALDMCLSFLKLPVLVLIYIQYVSSLSRFTLPPTSCSFMCWLNES